VQEGDADGSMWCSTTVQIRLEKENKERKEKGNKIKKRLLCTFHFFLTIRRSILPNGPKISFRSSGESAPHVKL